MKRVMLIQFFIGAFFISKAQISLERACNFPGTFTKPANSGYKSYLIYAETSHCRIYNTNRTLWKTINFSVPAGNYLYDTKFVSETLFTSENAHCLAYICNNYNSIGRYYACNAGIVKENGAELLSIPGCQNLCVHNLESAGTKMITYCYDYSMRPYTVQTMAYGLPRQLVYVPGEARPTDPAWALAFPNPAGRLITISYTSPAGIPEYELMLSEANGRILKTWNVADTSWNVSINAAGFPGGIYLYALKSGNYLSESHKMIIQ